MIQIIKTAITYIIMLGILVVVHEWGHFIVARIFKIRVDEFAIGFGPRALRIGRRGDTEYNVRWIPLGGYVKIAGMEPDEEPLLAVRDKAQKFMGTDESALSKAPLLAENLPNMEETEAQRKNDAVDGFYSKPLWQRSLVIFAGPLMSFLFGYFLFCTIGFFTGTPFADNEVDHVAPNSVAQQIGLKAHDRIVKIDDTTITDGIQMVDIIHHSANKMLTLTIARGGQTVIIKGTPKVQPGEDSGGYPIFGFTPGEEIRHATFRESIAMGNDMTVQVFSNLETLIRNHKLSEFRSHAGGPIYIAEVTSQAVRQGPPFELSLAAQLSISLAIFNLFPIPILDGGHLLLFFVEAVRRGRRLTLEQQQNFMLAGLAIIGILFIFIMINDVTRHVTP
jgi:regulator of sigma E protease